MDGDSLRRLILLVLYVQAMDTKRRARIKELVEDELLVEVFYRKRNSNAFPPWPTFQVMVLVTKSPVFTAQEPLPQQDFAHSPYHRDRD
jgi:hypothetical protein